MSRRETSFQFTKLAVFFIIFTSIFDIVDLDMPVSLQMPVSLAGDDAGLSLQRSDY